MNCIYCGEQSETEVCESCKRAGFDFDDLPTLYPHDDYSDIKNCNKPKKQTDEKDNL